MRICTVSWYPPRAARWRGVSCICAHTTTQICTFSQKSKERLFFIEIRLQKCIVTIEYKGFRDSGCMFPNGNQKNYGCTSTLLEKKFRAWIIATNAPSSTKLLALAIFLARNLVSCIHVHSTFLVGEILQDLVVSASGSQMKQGSGICSSVPLLVKDISTDAKLQSSYQSHDKTKQIPPILRGCRLTPCSWHQECQWRAASWLGNLLETTQRLFQEAALS